MFEVLNDALQDSLEVRDYKEAKKIVSKMEKIIIRNIFKDEEKVENGIDPTNLLKNEEIKKTIVLANKEIYKDNKNIKVYLDDKRKTPDGYIRAFWPEDVYTFLNNLNVVELSLDHDLGDDTHGTGYDVVCYIEEKIYLEEMDLIPIKVHSDNSSAVKKMKLGISNINALCHFKR